MVLVSPGAAPVRLFACRRCIFLEDGIGIAVNRHPTGEHSQSNHENSQKLLFPRGDAMSVPQGDDGREDEADANRCSCTGELEGVPNAGNEIGTQEDNRHKSGREQAEPNIISCQRNRRWEEQAVQVEAKRVEHNREDEHEMERVADTNTIIQLGTKRDAKISVEVGQHIIKNRITKQEEPKEAGHDVND